MDLVQSNCGSVIKHIKIKTEDEVIRGVERKYEFRCTAGTGNTARFISCRRVRKLMRWNTFILL
jgi:hypothetical protein